MTNLVDTVSIQLPDLMALLPIILLRNGDILSYKVL